MPGGVPVWFRGMSGNPVRLVRLAKTEQRSSGGVISLLQSVEKRINCDNPYKIHALRKFQHNFCRICRQQFVPVGLGPV
jgi:hypothetical protein